MPNYTYIRDIPFATHNPSADQPDMQQNTNATDSLIGEDHFSFNDNEGGLHRKTRLFNGGAATVPTGIAGNMGTLYTNLVATKGVTTESSLMYVPDGFTTDTYQLTRTITADFPTFSTNGPYGTPAAPIVTQNGGWTFLPGGLLFQYGLAGPFTASPGTIEFPVAFTSGVYSVIVTSQAAGGSRVYVVNAVGLTSFTVSTATTGVSTNIYWTAIGK